MAPGGAADTFPLLLSDVRDSPAIGAPPPGACSPCPPRVAAGFLGLFRLRSRGGFFLIVGRDIELGTSKKAADSEGAVLDAHPDPGSLVSGELTYEQATFYEESLLGPECQPAERDVVQHHRVGRGRVSRVSRYFQAYCVGGTKSMALPRVGVGLAGLTRGTDQAYDFALAGKRSVVFLREHRYPFLRSRNSEIRGKRL